MKAMRATVSKEKLLHASTQFCIGVLLDLPESLCSVPVACIRKTEPRTFSTLKIFVVAMAVAVLGAYGENELIGNRIMRPSRRLERRHYKKDSRFVLDLYTLTYDSHESLDSLGDLSERRYESADAKDMFNGGRNSAWLKHNKNGRRFRRPNLQSRLQDGNNLQLCFVNEQPCELEENYIDEGIVSLPVIFQSKCMPNNMNMNSLPVENEEIRRTYYRTSETTGNNQFDNIDNTTDSTTNYYKVNDDKNESKSSDVNSDTTRWSSDLPDQITEALSKKAHEETCQKAECNHRQRCDSPITYTIKSILKKVCAEDDIHHRGPLRMNKNMLTKMNVNQLQAIIGDLHSHVEHLNEQLMKMLMERDELHMSRDSLLVDIEGLTKYL